MRFHRGSMVEVLTKKKDPSGVWRCAQVVEDNGDGYTVRYYRFLGIAKDSVDKVPAEAVRPRPPPMAASTVWAVGDVVEVLDDGYWRVSMIEEVLADDCYHIQVIGSVDEFRVKKSSIRARQEWKGNQWTPMGKDVGINGKLMSRMHHIHMAHTQKQGDLMCLKDVQEPVLLTKKRRTVDNNLITDRASLVCAQKRRAVDRVERHMVHDCSSFVGKVDNSVNVRGTQCKVVVQKKATRINNASYRSPNDAHPLGRTCELDGCASSKSSVASCSIGDANLDRLVSHSSTSCSQNTASLCSDADSLNHDGDDEAVSVPGSKLEDTLRMHEKELYSYRCTLEALYACGPLSWELETYLTNLRQKYSVSTDEHLMELKRLRAMGNLGLSCY